MEINLNVNSTPEDVANFFYDNLKISNNIIKNNIINMHIQGDVLLDLTEDDFKSLGIKLGPKKKIQKYLELNKNNFKEKEIKEKITTSSNSEEIKIFFEKCLNFKGNLNNLNGNELIQLDGNKMKDLGLNLGQRKKLVKYINFFKTLKIENPKEEEVNKDFVMFLKQELNFSDDSIKKIIEDFGLDAETLLLLNESDIEKMEINKGEKINLIKYLNLNNENIKIKIDNKSI